MGEASSVARRITRAGLVVGITALVAACNGGPIVPAPVIMRGDGTDMSGEGPVGPPPPGRMAPLPRLGGGPGREIVVRPGQSVGRLAEEYHVTVRAIIAANHLQPPYKVETGQHLRIPGGRGPMWSSSSVAAGAPLPPLAAAPVSTSASSQPPSASSPDVIPLDGPAPPPHASAQPTQRPAQLAAAAALRPPPGPTAAEEARVEPEEPAPAPRSAAAAPGASLPHGGRMPWPVQGRVLTGYGGAAGGRHNDGINIAAPRGTPVKAVEGGVVAYAGNELRGYGNLVLIKHPDGLITAYAHCEELLVHRGDKISRGEVIAKVGSTGGVSEPQLHFELRRGERAVDPREFLAPAPSATARAEPGNG